jgi:hypothetical protein
MHEDEFIRDRVKRLQEAAADADPFVKRRLLRLAENYARRLHAATLFLPNASNEQEGGGRDRHARSHQDQPEAER